MTRDKLIGTWHCALTNVTHALRANGTCEIRTVGHDGSETAEWEWLDAKHWKLMIVIPPDPHSPGLEDGAVEVIEYTIESEQPDQMSLSQADVEFAWEWRRVNQ